MSKMITKIKELMQVREKIDELIKRIEDQEKAIECSCKESQNLKGYIMQIRKENRKVLDKLMADKEDIGSFEQNLKDELYDFKLFKKGLEDTLSKRIITEFNILRDEMKKSIQEFNDTKRKLDTKLSGIKKLDAEINRLISITCSISRSDFDLEKIADKLREAEKEKLTLHRKIDALERLVAKMRRRH